MSAARILEKLEALEHKGPDGRGWFKARCPAPSHVDHHASFGWKVHEDDHVEIKCQAGCTTDAIVAALGMTKRDLFNGQDGAARPVRRRPVARYDYRAADGLLA